jgi:hypothetical protein
MARKDRNDFLEEASYMANVSLLWWKVIWRSS